MSNGIPDSTDTSGSTGGISTPHTPQQADGQMQDVFFAGLSSLADLFKLGGNTVMADQVRTDTLSAAPWETQSDKGKTLLNNPKLGPATKEAVALLAKQIEAGQPVGMSTEHYNAFLGGLVGVALLMSIMDFMKTQQAGEKITSEMWVDIEKQTMELADAIAANIEDKAKAEAIGYIAKAVLSAGCAVVSAGGFAASKGWIPKMGSAKTATGFQQMQMATTAINTMLTGVAGNLIEAELTIVKGHLDALKIILETEKDISSSMMSKMDKANEDFTKAFDSFMQALQNWMTKLSEVGNKIGTA